MRNLLAVLFCLLYSVALQAQSDAVYQDQVMDRNIRTVQWQLNDLLLSTPVLALNAGDYLKLSFDDLNSDVRNMRYTIQLCNQDWTIAGLNKFDYLQGFQDNPLTDYKNSFNTEVHYIHYTVTLPNSTMKFTKSGNYLLVITDSDNGDTLIVRRFMVTENKAVITGQEIRPRNPKFMQTHQELEFQIDCKGIDVANPFDDIKVVIQQNGRPDNEIRGIQPQFIQDNILKFNSDVDCLFPGLKEFRKIDIRTVRFRSLRVERNVNDSTPAKVYLYPEALRSFKQYVYEKDFNGAYVVERQEAVQQATEADYVWVYFSMPFTTALEGGDFYLCNQLTLWKASEEFKFHYNEATKRYELKALLKNGYYDYLIGFLEKGSTAFDFTPAEGNYYETENEYTVFVYYHPFSARYDQLIGVTSFHTMR